MSQRLNAGQIQLGQLGHRVQNRGELSTIMLDLLIRQMQTSQLRDMTNIRRGK